MSTPTQDATPAPPLLAHFCRECDEYYSAAPAARQCELDDAAADRAARRGRG